MNIFEFLTGKSMADEIQKLKQEVAELKTQLEITDDWASGLSELLTMVLPSLLRGHPEAEKVRDLLKKSHDRYVRLQNDPQSRTDDDLPLAALEPAKLLYRRFALLGVWPEVDRNEAAKEFLDP